MNIQRKPKKILFQALIISKKIYGKRKVQGIESDPFLQIEEKTFYWSRLNGKKRKKVTNQLLTKWTNIKRCRTFETFKEGYSLWRVEIGDGRNTASCICPKFGLYGCCKHVLVALVKLNKLSIPEEYSKKKIVKENKKRGRAEKAGPSLNKD